MTISRPVGRRPSSGRVFGYIGAGGGLTVALLAAAVRATGATAGQSRAEGAAGSVAFGVVLATPALLAVIGLLTGRFRMLAGAAIGCLAVAPISVLIVPMVIPAALLLIAFARGGEPPEDQGAQTLLTVGAAITPLVAAVGLLLFGMKPYTSAFAGGSEQGSFVPAAHAYLAIALAGADLALTTLAATTRRTQPNHLNFFHAR